MHHYQKNNISKSTLYIVPTPIGNLDDITKRAISILQSVNLIAAEDTRHTSFLLKHCSINTRLCLLHNYNEKSKTETLISNLQKGKNIALVSDAGTPLINDPGYYLVQCCLKNNIRIVPLPGACAAITALSASGLPSDRFCYEGFLPNNSKKRREYLQSLIEESRTLIFYESPHRLIASLEDMAITLGPERYVVLARELTKMWENIYRAPVGKLLSWIKEDKIPQRGEITLIVHGYNATKHLLSMSELHTLKLLMSELPLSKAIMLATKILGIKKNTLYRYAINNKSKLA